MLHWLFRRHRISKEALQANLDRIRFLMEYLQQHAFKTKREVIEALNRELLLRIPEELRDPESRVWPDPSNRNLTISFSCNDASHPERVDQFIIIGFEDLANTLIIGSAYEADERLMWSVTIESAAREIPPLATAVQEAIWQMPGWKVDGFGNFKYLEQIDT